MQGHNGFNMKPIVPGMGSVNIGSQESLVQIQFDSNMIHIVTHLDKGQNTVDYHDVVKLDYDGNILE